MLRLKGRKSGSGPGSLLNTGFCRVVPSFFTQLPTPSPKSRQFHPIINFLFAQCDCFLPPPLSEVHLFSSQWVLLLRLHLKSFPFFLLNIPTFTTLSPFDHPLTTAQTALRKNAEPKVLGRPSTDIQLSFLLRGTEQGGKGSSPVAFRHRN